ncbi:hypothetical protein M1N22_01745 [Dehalococcoidia bacterium]|nr:hypothetical protein [Dehalococcoidia bacterium]
MKPPNKRKLIIGVVMGLALLAVGFLGYVAGVTAYVVVDEAMAPGMPKCHYAVGYFERSIEKVIPGVLIARLELRGFNNPLSIEEMRSIQDDVRQRADAKELLSPYACRGFSAPGTLREGNAFVACGEVVGLCGVPGGHSSSADETTVAWSHERVREWFKEMTRRLTEHSYNRESMTRVIPGVFAGRLELRPLADPLSAAEKEALRNDVIARARAEGFLDAEHPEQDSLLHRLGGEPAGPFLNVEKKRGPHHIAYGYVVDSEGRPWIFEVSVNNEKEAAWVHQEARNWFGMFEGKPFHHPTFICPFERPAR